MFIKLFDDVTVKSVKEPIFCRCKQRIHKKISWIFIVVSNTTDHKDGVVCYHNKSYTKYTIPSKVDISCSVIGRYVIYFNERLPGIIYPTDYSRFAFTDLCEVEVYGKLTSDMNYKHKLFHFILYCFFYYHFV